MEDAKWYFTHETEEDRLWYRIFFAILICLLQEQQVRVNLKRSLHI